MISICVCWKHPADQCLYVFAGSIQQINAAAPDTVLYLSGYIWAGPGLHAELLRWLPSEKSCGHVAQRAFEGQMKPLTEQLKKLEGIPVPDFGPLDDWAANRNAEMQRRARRAAGHAPSF